MKGVGILMKSRFSFGKKNKETKEQKKESNSRNLGITFTGVFDDITFDSIFDKIGNNKINGLPVFLMYDFYDWNDGAKLTKSDSNLTTFSQELSGGDEDDPSYIAYYTPEELIKDGYILFLPTESTFLGLQEYKSHVLSKGFFLVTYDNDNRVLTRLSDYKFVIESVDVFKELFLSIQNNTLDSFVDSHKNIIVNFEDKKQEKSSDSDKTMVFSQGEINDALNQQDNPADNDSISNAFDDLMYNSEQSKGAVGKEKQDNNNSSGILSSNGQENINTPDFIPTDAPISDEDDGQNDDNDGQNDGNDGQNDGNIENIAFIMGNGDILTEDVLKKVIGNIAFDNDFNIEITLEEFTDKYLRGDEFTLINFELPFSEDDPVYCDYVKMVNHLKSKANDQLLSQYATLISSLKDKWVDGVNETVSYLVSNYSLDNQDSKYAQLMNDLETEYEEKKQNMDTVLKSEYDRIHDERENALQNLINTEIQRTKERFNSDFGKTFDRQIETIKSDYLKELSTNLNENKQKLHETFESNMNAILVNWKKDSSKQLNKEKLERMNDLLKLRAEYEQAFKAQDELLRKSLTAYTASVQDEIKHKKEIENLKLECEVRIQELTNEILDIHKKHQSEVMLKEKQWDDRLREFNTQLSEERHKSMSENSRYTKSIEDLRQDYENTKYNLEQDYAKRLQMAESNTKYWQEQHNNLQDVKVKQKKFQLVLTAVGCIIALGVGIIFGSYISSETVSNNTERHINALTQANQEYMSNDGYQEVVPQTNDTTQNTNVSQNTNTPSGA